MSHQQQQQQLQQQQKQAKPSNKQKPVEAVMSTNSVMCVHTIQQLAQHGITLLQTIGLGTYGKVKKAVYREPNGEETEVAVKIIDRRRASSTYVRSFLPREVQIVSLLHHPNVINTLRVLDIDRTNVCIVSEYAANGNLLHMVQRLKQIPDDRARVYFRHLFEALFYMHQRLHVIHRDLKCENILFDQYWNVKLADFGFARRMTPDDPPSSNFCGSKAYSAPEILSRQPYTGYASDMWSAGVVLYIALTGYMPYNDKNTQEQLKQQREHHINYHHREIHPDAHQLIYALLEPEPENRPKYEQIVTCNWLKDTPWEFRHGNRIYRKVVRAIESQQDNSQQSNIVDNAAKAVTDAVERESEHTITNIQ